MSALRRDNLSMVVAVIPTHQRDDAWPDYQPWLGVQPHI